MDINKSVRRHVSLREEEVSGAGIYVLLGI